MSARSNALGIFSLLVNKKLVLALTYVPWYYPFLILTENLPGKWRFECAFNIY